MTHDEFSAALLHAGTPHPPHAPRSGAKAKAPSITAKKKKKAGTKMPHTTSRKKSKGFGVK